jgi:hypothetical protein
VLGEGKTRCLITSWRLGAWRRVDTEHASAASHKLPLFPRNCCAVWLRRGVVEARRCWTDFWIGRIARIGNPGRVIISG